MNGSIARRDDAQYFFFVLLATLFRGVKPLNRCFAPCLTESFNRIPALRHSAPRTGLPYFGA